MNEKIPISTYQSESAEQSKENLKKILSLKDIGNFVKFKKKASVKTEIN